ncbi:GNAT family N-acetyltransferase [Litoreibacter roseus]|uniref:Alanine acetyltransferase n=1 Tax=Litoreibacter roseus TaxID=2601869 RepID=A0A6N6JB69_9RHOB|nr:GNAT family N-acetyltransferase [Litoreibacter roseus]GFE63304.1 alanine acetyltransferase [Litoreibacter roseus]
MTPAKLAALHKICFTSPRPWSVTEFSDMLGSRGVFLLTAPDGFLLGRLIADEAELLTVAVHPDRRGHGIGRKLIEGFLDTALDEGAADAFLEVASDNAIAINLYKSAGFTEINRRTGYYMQPDGTSVDAVLMTRSVSASGPADAR